MLKVAHLRTIFRFKMSDGAKNFIHKLFHIVNLYRLVSDNKFYLQLNKLLFFNSYADQHFNLTMIAKGVLVSTLLCFLSKV